MVDYLESHLNMGWGLLGGLVVKASASGAGGRGINPRGGQTNGNIFLQRGKYKIEAKHEMEYIKKEDF